MKTIFDVIVVGSGAGAMTAALAAKDQGLDVVIIEKADKFGGTSALSGGAIWVPNNSKFKKLGGKDDFDTALTYLKAATQGEVDEARLHAYLKYAPEMVEYLENHSQVRYAVAAEYPDYYPHLAGSLAGGRTLDPELFDSSKLHDHLPLMREASPATLLMGKIGWTARDAHLAISRKFGWQWMILRRMLRYKFDSKWRKKNNTKRDRFVGLGSSLIASLRASLMERNVPVLLNTEFVDYQRNDDRINGVIAKQNDKEIKLYANRGVIMGSGGFEQNQHLRETYLPQPTNTKWSATPPGQNTGQALTAGIKLGAATDLLSHAWWAPTVVVPKEDKARGLFAERAFPGVIVVDVDGKRFTNEAGPYLEFGEAMYSNLLNEGHDNPESYAIFDASFRFNYAIGPLMPGQIMPDKRLPTAWLNTVYWKADTLDELAGQLNINIVGLKETISKVNDYAKSGQDQDFARGGNIFDRYYGDRNVKPNPCLAPITKGPFYAVPIQAGDIGTKGGLLTNEYAQVLDSESKQPIAGLYAIGNCSAAVMGRSYPGAGSTLGPAMTFGYIAAHHIARG